MNFNAHSQSLLHPHHETRLFLLDGGAVLPLDHGRYVALVEGKAPLPEFAGRRLRLADWYVRMDDGKPCAVANETYGWLAFDKDGRLDPHAAHAIEGEALVSPGERERMRAIVFG